MHVAAAYCTEKIYLFVAEGVRPGTAHPDPDEFVSVETHSLAAVKEMIEKGEITDMKTVAGIMRYACNPPENNIQ
jgi:ADP-ribose pyrophosphatase